jgi:hypothetical protein
MQIKSLIMEFSLFPAAVAYYYLPIPSVALPTSFLSLFFHFLTEKERISEKSIQAIY